MKKPLIALLLLVTVFACNEDTAEPETLNAPDYLVFGQFASGMGNDDSQLFRVDRTTFEQDIVNEIFPRLDYEFESEITMSQADHSNAQQLLDLLPQSLIDTETFVYGCPDCHDQGGYFLEFGTGNQRKKVLLDIDDTTDQTEDIVSFKDAMATLLLLWED